jgi:hypothetical protein
MQTTGYVYVFPLKAVVSCLQFTECVSACCVVLVLFLLFDCFVIVVDE